eukprot:6213901-Pleurochrysis_carterae.AAC.2
MPSSKRDWVTNIALSPICMLVAVGARNSLYPRDWAVCLSVSRVRNLLAGMDPLILAEAKVILETVFSRELCAFICKKREVGGLANIFVAALDLKKCAASSLFCWVCAWLAGVVLLRQSRRSTDMRWGKQWRARSRLGMGCGGVKRIYLRTCRRVGAGVATTRIQTAGFCPGS